MEFQALRSAQEPGNAGWRDWSFPPVLIPAVSIHYPGKGIPGELQWDVPAGKLFQDLIPEKFIPMGIPHRDGMKEFHPVPGIPRMDPGTGRAPRPNLLGFGILWEEVFNVFLG